MNASRAADSVQFSSPSYVVGEGFSGNMIQLVRSGSGATTGQVEVVATDVSAINGIDYALATNVVTFAAGETNAPVLLSAIRDNIPETPETVMLALANPSAGLELGATAEATVTIYDQAAVVRWENTPIYWSEANETSFEMVLVRTGNAELPFTLGFTTVDGSAKAGEDYVAVSGQIEFLGGVGRATIPLSVLNDSQTENQESFRVVLSNLTPWIDVRMPSAAQVLIQDDDLGYGICCSNTIVDENAGSIAVYVRRDGSYDFTSTVDYFTVPSVATPDLDYTPVSGTLQFKPGDGPQRIDIPILNDALAEGNESFRVVLTNASNGLSIGERQATITIRDNDRGFRFESNVQAVESVDEAVVTVLRANDEDSPMSVDYYTEPGSATPGADYTPVSGTLTFGPDDVSQLIHIPILNDGLRESTESFRVVLTNSTPPDLVGNPHVVSVSIQSNDDGFGISGSPFQFGESAGEAVITVTRGNDVPGEVTVDYATEPGTATPGEDYGPVSGTLRFADGELSQQIRVPLLNDSLKEPNETFRIVLSHPSEGTSLASQSAATVYIMDNDGGFRFTSGSTVSVPETQGVLSVWVERGLDTTNTVSVDYTTIPETATPGSDYTTASGTLVFAPDQTTAVIQVPILNDGEADPRETFRIELSHPSEGAALGQPAVCHVSIDDNDAGFVFECSQTYCFSVPENAGQAKVDVVIAGDFVLTAPASVDYHTEPGTATPEVDYVSTSGTLTFQPGQTRQTITVPILNDSSPEPVEEFRIVLTNAIGVPIAASRFVSVTIQDNETGYHLASGSDGGPLLVRETNGPVPLAVVREGDFDLTSSVDFRIASTDPFGSWVGTAVPGVDFEPSSGTLTFAPGETNQFIFLSLLEDDVVEPSKSVVVYLSGASGGVPIAVPEQRVVIQDKEHNPLRVDPAFRPTVAYAHGGYGRYDANLQVLPDGRIVMLTSLWTKDGLEPYGIVRLRPDGELDPTFRMVRTSGLRVLVADPNGEVLIAGPRLFTVNGRPTDYIARLDADGSVDPFFRARLPKTVADVITITPLPDRTVLVGTEDGGLFRLKADGALDTSFVAPRLTGPVRRMAVDSLGRIVIGGDFYQVDDQPRSRLARLLPSGTLDRQYLATPEFEVADFRLLADDAAIIQINAGSWRIERLTPDGIIDPDFHRIERQQPVTWVQFFAATADRKVVVSENSEDGTQFLTRAQPDGQPDPEFSPGTYTVQLAPDWWAGSFTAVPEPTGNLLILGSVAAVNGQARPALARLLLNLPSPRVDVDERSAAWTETNGIATIKLVRTGKDSAPLAVNWATKDGTAKAGVDYTPAAGTVTFAPGQSEEFIQLPLLDNTRPDGDRTVLLQFSSAGGNPLPDAMVTIVNDDLGFVLSGATGLGDGALVLHPTGYGGYVGLQRSSNLRDWIDWGSVGTAATIIADDPGFFYRLVRY